MRLSGINKRMKSSPINGAKTLPESKLLDMYYKKRFFNVSETAEYLNISEKTIRNKLSLGTFPIKAKRLGRKNVRFEVTDVIRYADSL